jgi:hypothetical protein
MRTMAWCFEGSRLRGTRTSLVAGRPQYRPARLCDCDGPAGKCWQMRRRTYCREVGTDTIGELDCCEVDSAAHVLCGGSHHFAHNVDCIFD